MSPDVAAALVGGGIGILLSLVMNALYLRWVWRRCRQ
jgi:hypothetical protein